jgi:HEPN domain-containing protein
MSVDENIHEWKRLADLDLSVANHLAETHHPTPIEPICFHSQQAAEKMIKCFMVLNSIKPPHTHDLSELLKLCVAIESGFDQFRRESAILSRYGVMPRYPYDLELEEHDAKTAILYAEKICDYVNGFVFPPAENEVKSEKEIPADEIDGNEDES